LNNQNLAPHFKSISPETIFMTFVLIVGWSLFMALIIYLVIASSDPEHP